MVSRLFFGLGRFDVDFEPKPLLFRDVHAPALAAIRGNDAACTAVSLRGLSEHSDVRELADAIALNSHVTTLDLFDGDLGRDENMQILAAALARNSTISVLKLRQSRLDGIVLARLAPALKHASITELDLSGNPISDAGASELFAALRDASSLTKLVLAGCAVKDAGAWRIPDGLARPSVLDLSSNRLQAAGVPHLLSRATFLSTLDLRGASLGDDGMRAVVNALAAANASLTRLVLRSNDIGHEGLLQLADAFAANSVLTSLDIGHNRLADAGAMYVADAIRVASTITQLDLSSNGITLAGLRFLADALKVNTSATDIDLSDNRLSEPQLAPLMDDLAARRRAAEGRAAAALAQQSPSADLVPESLSPAASSFDRISASPNATSASSPFDGSDLSVPTPPPPASDSSPEPLPAPSRFAVDAQHIMARAEFECGEPIGVGAFGTVYAGARRADAQPVALKSVLVERPRTVHAGEQFARLAELVSVLDARPLDSATRSGIVLLLREVACDAMLELGAQLLCRGEHTLRAHGICVRSVDSKFVTLWLVCDRADGDLRSWILDDPPPAECLRACAQVARGLAELHEARVVHLDLKPANVLVLDGGRRFCVSDFGLSRNASTVRTAPWGTPAYSAPEQLLARQRPAPSMDVWALGTLVVEVFGGVRDGAAGSLSAVLAEREYGLLPDRPASMPDAVWRVVLH